jgi:hypothetical protein
MVAIILADNRIKINETHLLDYKVIFMPSCKVCRWWRPDIFFVYIGDCNKKPNAFEDDNKSCFDYEPVKVETEFMWCSDCMVTFHKSELGRHRQHDIHSSFHVDFDAHEYVCGGD